MAEQASRIRIGPGATLLGRLLTCLCLLLTWLQIQPAAAASNRIALVIGNGNYDHLPRLPNSPSDAVDMAAKLQKLGFQVVLETDADRGRMQRAIDTFAERLKSGGAGLFYFSGHGVQFQQKNYLIPVGGRIRTIEDVVAQAVNVDEVLDALKAKPRDFNLVILDACNDTELETRDGRKPTGLARTKAPPGTFIAYAAGVGQLASAGWNRNSLFTAELLKLIDEPGLSIHEIFQKTRRRVVEISLEDQVPVDFNALTKTFYFIPPVKQPPAAGPAVAKEDFKPGDEFRDCDECPLMVVLPAGEFQMGSANGRDLERPVHTVEIPRPFAIGKYEVTFDQWQACVAEGGCLHRPDDAGFGGGDRPVINVSWDDAKEYVRWLSRKTGKSYRLPSEAEWEYAARAGASTPYWWGAEAKIAAANWSAAQTTPVGSYQPNPFGLYDVHGNVWEWVEDCRGDYARAPTDGTASSPLRCEATVVRGGSFQRDSAFATASFRGGLKSADRRAEVGFRVARAVQ